VPALDPSPLLAYGPAPGVELIPYFLGLLTWVGVAFAAVLLAPVSALLRRLRRRKGAPPPDPVGQVADLPKQEAGRRPAPQAPAPESPGNGNPDRA
jgi:hypothetical protein